MKATFVFVGLLATFSAAFARTNELDLEVVPQQQRIFESVIEDLVNSVREILAKYDPIHIDHQELSLLGHDGQITNLNAAGFSDFKATHVSLGGLITWTLELDIEATKVSGSVENWQIDGDVIYGNGAGSVLVENFKISIVAKISPLSMTLKELKIKPSIGKADVSITGIHNDEAKSKEISDRINHFLNDTVNNNSSLHDRISEILFEIAKKILESLGF